MHVDARGTRSSDAGSTPAASTITKNWNHSPSLLWTVIEIPQNLQHVPPVALRQLIGVDMVVGVRPLGAAVERRLLRLLHHPGKPRPDDSE